MIFLFLYNLMSGCHNRGEATLIRRKKTLLRMNRPRTLMIYQGSDASFELETAKILLGQLPPKVFKMKHKFLQHHTELLVQDKSHKK